MVGCPSEKLSLEPAGELCVSTALQRSEPVSQVPDFYPYFSVNPSPTMAQHSEPWCLASQGRQSQAFGQDRCLSVLSPCKAFINQGGFWLIAAALRAGLSQQSGTVAFSSFAEQEPLYVCLSACLP